MQCVKNNCHKKAVNLQIFKTAIKTCLCSWIRDFTVHLSGIFGNKKYFFPYQFSKVVHYHRRKQLLFWAVLQKCSCSCHSTYRRSNATDKEWCNLKCFLMTHETETGYKSHQFLILLGILRYFLEAHSKPSQTSKLELLSKIVNGWKRFCMHLCVL